VSSIVSPDDVPLFHITAIQNLPGIVASHGLWPKASLGKHGIAYADIAYQSIQSRRSVKQVTAGPGGVIHDYTPFYFAPRSPMLFSINNGNVPDCNYKQDDIVHIRTTIGRVKHRGFVFYNFNAATSFAKCFDDLEKLGEINWPLFFEPPQLDGYCRFWHNIHSNERYVKRMETRQAEFLVHGHVPLDLIEEVVARTPAIASNVENILRSHGWNVPVRSQPLWYF
jgi:hypothetical protein